MKIKSHDRFRLVRRVLSSSLPIFIFFTSSLLMLTLGHVSARSSNDKTDLLMFKNNNIDVVGRVINEDNIGLAGASVKVKNSDKSTLTDRNGNFILKNVNPSDILTISYLGYEKMDIRVGADMSSIKLELSNSKLDEVQIIAYGTTTQRLSTGNISSVKAVDIENQPVSNPLAILQGRIPGMIVTQTSGVAGSSFKVQIRGQSSLDANLSKNDPLFIIDGVPFEVGNSATNQINSAANNPTSVSTGGLSALNSINPQDIESIDVLKDADATAIYGSRGANGVILITTKKGVSGKTRINFNAYSGFSRVGKTMKMLNTEQYISMRKEAFYNDNLVPSANSLDAGYAPDIMLWDNKRYNDFKKLLIGNTSHSSNIQSSISGGNSTTQFLISANNHKETTVFSKSLSDNIASLHYSISHSAANNKFNILLSGIYSNDRNQMPRYDLTKYINTLPNLRLYNDDGTLSWSENGITYSSINNITNPLSFLKEQYSSENNNLSNNLNLSYRIFKGLLVRANMGYNSFESNEVTTRPKSAIDPNSSILPSSAFGNSRNSNWIIEPQIEYKTSSNYGKVSVLLGNTLQSKKGNSSIMYGSNYTSDLLLNSIMAAGNITASNDNVLYRYTAFFSRLNYNYKDRYIVNISARRDGSSRFAPNSQWANFGAIGLAWVFANENAVKNNFPTLSYGKLRSSYGTSGNDQIGDYKFLNLWSSTSNTYEGISGLYPNSLYNKNYNWEVTKKFEIALDLGFFNDNLLFSGSFYRNRSDNQLVSYSLPSQTGFFQVVRNFPGLVQNSGFEFVLNTKNISNKRFKWSTAFNISIPRNKLISFPNLKTSSYSRKYQEGKSLSQIYALNYIGVDATTGLYTFVDVNKDGVIYDEDYQWFGNTDPKFYGGLQNNFTFRGFDLSFHLQFTKQKGLSYINELSSTVPGTIFNQPDLVLGRWRQIGDNTSIQKFSQSFSNNAITALGNFGLSNGKFTDASFVKLRNVSIAYHLPKRLLDKARLNDCRLYIEGQNLLTFTNYIGGDPETQNFYVLPPLKTIVLGIQLTL